MCADRSVYLPFIEFEANGQVNITVHYFNKWKGLVKWTSRYVTLDDVERGNSVCCYNKLIQPGDAEVTVISYDCGTLLKIKTLLLSFTSEKMLKLFDKT